MPGVMLRHATARSEAVLVSVLSKPFAFDSLKECPGCHFIHLCKTVHLVVNDTGLVMVSLGVLEDLKAAGMPGLVVVGEEAKPPTLVLGGSNLNPLQDRARQDQVHRRIIVSR